jgi:hypothetical protein
LLEKVIDRCRDTGNVITHSLIADQARAVPRELGRALAGVNRDFYVRDNPTYLRR